jgi:hypothetical protein
MWGVWQDYQDAGIFATIKEEEQKGLVCMTKRLLPTEVLLDNQANISIVNPRLLKNVRECKHQIQVKGVGGTQLSVNKVGDLDGFFEVCASEHTTANVRCFADVEDKYDITYHKGRTSLYMYATVKENEQVYTRDEAHRANLAYELVHNSGYPSPNKVVHLLQEGNVRGIPATLAKADIE